MCLWSIFLISDWCLFGELNLGARIFIMAQDLWDCSGTSLWVQEGWQRHGYPLWVPRWHQKASGPQAASRYLAQVHTTASSTVMSFPSLSLLFLTLKPSWETAVCSAAKLLQPSSLLPLLCFIPVPVQPEAGKQRPLGGVLSWLGQGRWLRRVSQPAH